VSSIGKTRVLTFVTSAAFFCAAALNLPTGYARDLAGVSMPEKVSVSRKQLQLNGIGVGKKAFFKIYVIALYLESPTSDARNAIKADEAKRIVLTMLRDVSRERFVQAVEEDMERNPGVPMSALRGRLDRLESVLPALNVRRQVFFPLNDDLGNHLKPGHTLSLQNRPTEVIQNNSSYNSPPCILQRF
jgi:hypothetical protein